VRRWLGFSLVAPAAIPDRLLQFGNLASVSKVKCSTMLLSSLPKLELFGRKGTT